MFCRAFILVIKGMSKKRPREEDQRIKGPVQERQLTHVFPGFQDLVGALVPKATTSKTELCKEETQNSKLCQPLHATMVKRGQHLYDCTAYCSRFLVQKVPEIIECIGEFTNRLRSNGGDIGYVTADFVTFVGDGEYLPVVRTVDATTIGHPTIRWPSPQLMLTEDKSWPRGEKVFKLGEFWAHMNPNRKIERRNISTREQFVKAVSDRGFNAVVIRAYLLNRNGRIPKCLGENVFSVYKTKCCDIVFRCVHGDSTLHNDYSMVGSITEKTVSENRGVRQYLSGKYKRGILRNAVPHLGSEQFARMEGRQLDNEDIYEEDLPGLQGRLAYAPPPPPPEKEKLYHQIAEEALRSNPEEKRNRDRSEFRKERKKFEKRTAEGIGKNRVPSWPGKKSRRLPRDLWIDEQEEDAWRRSNSRLGSWSRA